MSIQARRFNGVPCCEGRPPMFLKDMMIQYPGMAAGLNFTEQMREFVNQEIGSRGKNGNTYRRYGIPRDIRFDLIGMPNLDYFRKNWAAGTYNYNPAIVVNEADTTAECARYLTFVEDEAIRTFARRDPYELWCRSCKNELEEFRDVMSSIDWTAMFTQFATVVSYVPVLGTAVAFIIETAVGIANGESIDDSVLKGVGGCLPGQPMAKMAFDVAYAAAKGQPIDEMLIAAIPISEAQKVYVRTTVSICKSIADGRPILDVALDQISNQLSPDGKRALELARRAMHGENIGDIALEEAGRAAMAGGTDAMNKFLAQVGYQQMVNSLPEFVRDGLTVGLTSGIAVVTKDPPARPTVALGRVESAAARAVNDPLQRKGLGLIVSGISVKGPTGYPTTLASIRDTASGATPLNRDPWRRGFDIAVGLCEGMALDGPGQQAIQKNLGSIAPMSGFAAGQKIQFTRTQQNQLAKGITDMATGLGRSISAQDRAAIEGYARKGAAIASSVPTVAAARALNADGRFRWGFDIATGLCEGMWLPGPGQDAIRVKLGPFSGGSGPDRGNGSNEAIQGFNVGQALQHGISKSRNDSMLQGAQSLPANEGAGMLIAAGIVGSGSPVEQKVETMQLIASNPGTAAGATTVINAKAGLFARLRAWLGL